MFTFLYTFTSYVVHGPVMTSTGFIKTIKILWKVIYFFRFKSVYFSRVCFKKKKKDSHSRKPKN